MKRALIILALVALVALPFALRPKADAARKTDDTVVVITPHNEAIRHEYALGFADWYQRRTGRTVSIDWRIVGGTSEIARFLEGEFSAAFELHWVRTLGRPWSAEVSAGFQNGRLRPDAPAAASMSSSGAEPTTSSARLRPVGWSGVACDGRVRNGSRRR